MGTNRISSMAAVGAALLGVAISGSASGATGSDAERVLECRPVAVTWPASSAGAPQVEGPKLSVVQTRVKPKSARLFLDGRFVGRAHHFRGKKGFLYLLPGRYRLEVVKEGFATEVLTILARPSCKFDLEVSMTKRKGSGTESG